MDMLEVSENGLKKLKNCYTSVTSLNAPTSCNTECDQTVEDLIADESAMTADEEAMKNEKFEAMRMAMDELNGVHRDILAARYLNNDPETLADIGARHGVSKERIRQLETEALTKMKNKMARMTSIGQ
jgi:RNA polymerase sigma factor (sigma-70 family)